MDDADIFVYAMGRQNRFYGALEANHDVSWFYLADQDLDPEGGQFIGAVHVYQGLLDFTESDVEVRWYDHETKVGVFIKEELGGYFDLVTGWGYPGTYWKGRRCSASGDPGYSKIKPLRKPWQS